MTTTEAQDREELVLKINDLMQRTRFEDAIFLYPHLFQTNRLSMLKEIAEKIAEKRKPFEVKDEDFEEAEKVLSRKLSRKIPKRSKPKEEIGNLEDLLVMEYYVDYSFDKRSDFSERLLAIAVCEYARIEKERNKNISEKHVLQWGFDLALDLMIREESEDKTYRLRKINPAISLFAVRYIDTFENPFLLQYVLPATSKIELKLLKIVDKYYSLIKKLPKEKAIVEFIDNPSRFEDKEEAINVVNEFKKDYDKKIRRVKDGLKRHNSYYSSNIRNTVEMLVARDDTEKIKEIRKQAKETGDVDLINEATDLLRVVEEKLREYGRALNEEKENITTKKEELDIMLIGAQVLFEQDNYVQQAEKYISLKDKLDIITSEFPNTPSHQELEKLFNETYCILKQVTSVLDERYSSGLEFFKTKLREEKEKEKILEGKSIEEVKKLELTEGKITQLSDALSLMKYNARNKESLASIKLKIKSYDNKVKKVSKIKQELGELVNEFPKHIHLDDDLIDYYKRANLSKERNRKKLQEIFVDSGIKANVDHCKQSIRTLDAGLVKLVNLVETKLDGIVYDIKSRVDITENKTIDNYRTLDLYKDELERNNKFYEFFCLNSTNRDQLLELIQAKKSKYIQIKRQRTIELKEYVTETSRLLDKIIEIFKTPSVEGINQFRRSLNETAKKYQKLSEYSTDENLQVEVENAEKMFSSVRSKFRNTYNNHISNLKAYYSILETEINGNPKNTIQAINELKVKFSSLTTLEEKVEIMMQAGIISNEFKREISRKKNEIRSWVQEYAEKLKENRNILDSSNSKITKLYEELLLLSDIKIDYNSFYKNGSESDQIDVLGTVIVNFITDVLRIEEKCKNFKIDDVLRNHDFYGNLNVFKLTYSGMINNKFSYLIQETSKVIEYANSLEDDTEQGIEGRKKVDRYLTKVLGCYESFFRCFDMLNRDDKDDIKRGIINLSKEINNLEASIEYYSKIKNQRAKHLDKLNQEFNENNFIKYLNEELSNEIINEFGEVYFKYMDFRLEIKKTESWRRDGALKTYFETLDHTEEGKIAEVRTIYRLLLEGLEKDIFSLKEEQERYQKEFKWYHIVPRKAMAISRKLKAKQNLKDYLITTVQSVGSQPETH